MAHTFYSFSKILDLPKQTSIIVGTPVCHKNIVVRSYQENSRKQDEKNVDFVGVKNSL